MGIELHVNLSSQLIVDGAEWFQSQLSQWGALRHSDVVRPHHLLLVDPCGDEHRLRLSHRDLLLLLYRIFL